MSELQPQVLVFYHKERLYEQGGYRYIVQAHDNRILAEGGPYPTHAAAKMMGKMRRDELRD